MLKEVDPQLAEGVSGQWELGGGRALRVPGSVQEEGELQRREGYQAKASGEGRGGQADCC